MNVGIGHRIRSKILSFSAQFETPEIGSISDICFTVEPAASSLLGDTADHVRFNRIEEGELAQIHSLLQLAIRQWPIDSLFPLLDLLSSRIQCFFLLISLPSNHSIGIHRNASTSSLHLCHSFFHSTPQSLSFHPAHSPSFADRLRQFGSLHCDRASLPSLPLPIAPQSSQFLVEVASTRYAARSLAVCGVFDAVAGSLGGMGVWIHGKSGVA